CAAQTTTGNQPTSGPLARGTSVGSGPPAAAATTPQPKAGGGIRWAGTSGLPHLDPQLTTSSNLYGHGIGVCWSRLLKYKLRDIRLPATVPIPDLAESWEQPDDLTYLFKLRRNVKWHNLPPANG